MKPGTRIQSVKYDIGNQLRPKVAPLTLAIGSALVAGPALAGQNTVTVNSLSGGFPQAQCSLRQAIATVNTGTPPALSTCADIGDGTPTIEFSDGLEGTIEIDGSEDGSLTIEESVTIDGDGRIAIENTSNGSVFVAEDTVGTLTIDSLEITGGQNIFGGGISSQADELDIQDSVLSGNTAFSLQGIGGSGGAISHNPAPGGMLRVQNSVFENNQAESFGGAIRTALDGGQLQVDENEFASNEAIAGGGALYINGEQNDLFFMKYNEFSNNNATVVDSNGQGGGAFIALDQVDDAQIKYNDFTSNEATYDGGGLFIEAIDSESLELGENTFSLNDSLAGNGGGIDASLENSQLYAGAMEFEFNTAANSGGGVFISASDDSTIGIQDSLFKYNSANTSESVGTGGAITITGEPEEVALSYTSVRGNEARVGGGIAIGVPNSEADVFIENSEISGNEAGIGGSGAGGGINANLGDDASLFVTNSTVSGNSGAFRGGGISQTGGVQADFKYSTIADNQAEDYGGGLFSDDTTLCAARNSIFDNQADGEPQDIDGSNCLVNHSLLAAASNSDYSAGSGIIADEDPMLGSLEDNNGAGTYTHRPLDGSPVIEAGEADDDTPEYDQRGSGYNRVVGAEIDMGAHEIQELEDEIFQDRFESN